MAAGSSIYKANLSLANLNTHYYKDFSLTIAMHPSETEERMFYRILAFLYSAHEDLEFSNGLSNPDHPDIWQKNLCGDIQHWIDLGQPDEKRIKKASGRSELVSVFTYNPSKASAWLEKIKSKIKHNKKLKIYNFKEIENGPVERLVERSMNLTCLIEDQSVFLSNDDLRIQIDVEAIIF